MNEITPDGNVLEIHSGKGFASLEFSGSREILPIDSNVDLVQMARSPSPVANFNLQEGNIRSVQHVPKLNAAHRAVLTFYGVVTHPARARDANRTGRPRR